MNKSHLSNVISAAILAVGYLFGSSFLISVGMFALSGALTNWLAIYMLFEKVPGLYGSGVVPTHFEEFKVGIRELLMKQFFTRENMHRFLATEKQDHVIDLGSVLEKTDLNPAFDGLVNVIESSSFGSMLSMVGGREALQPLREPFLKRLKTSLLDVASSDEFQQMLRANLASQDTEEAIRDKVSEVIEQRLDELSPEMVKQIVQAMIAKHLGWLVVWGAVFGGLIGALAAFL